MTTPDLLDSLQKANADLTAALSRYADLHRAHNALQHEHEALKERLAAAGSADRVVADRVVCCGHPSCSRELRLSGLVREGEVPTWVRLAGWSLKEGVPQCQSH